MNKYEIELKLSGRDSTTFFLNSIEEYNTVLDSIMNDYTVMMTSISSDSNRIVVAATVKREDECLDGLEPVDKKERIYAW